MRENSKKKRIRKRRTDVEEIIASIKAKRANGESLSDAEHVWLAHNADAFNGLVPEEEPETEEGHGIREHDSTGA